MMGLHECLSLGNATRTLTREQRVLHKNDPHSPPFFLSLHVEISLREMRELLLRHLLATQKERSMLQGRSRTRPRRTSLPHKKKEVCFKASAEPVRDQEQATSSEEATPYEKGNKKEKKGKERTTKKS